jgi:hypothetical protein
VITDSKNGASALYGSTNGEGAGLSGYNTGTGGSGGKFYVTNPESVQPGASATTNGYGPAILGTFTNPNGSSPAIYGQSLAKNTSISSGIGIGVEGDGDAYGVVGEALSAQGVGVEGDAYESSETNPQAGGRGVVGTSANGIGVYGIDFAGGIGIYGTSQTGYAGYFYGPVAVNGALTARVEGGDAVYGNSGTGYGTVGVTNSGVGIYGGSGEYLIFCVFEPYFAKEREYGDQERDSRRVAEG